MQGETYKKIKKKILSCLNQFWEALNSLARDLDLEWTFEKDTVDCSHPEWSLSTVSPEFLKPPILSV